MRVKFNPWLLVVVVAAFAVWHEPLESLLLQWTRGHEFILYGVILFTALASAGVLMEVFQQVRLEGLGVLAGVILMGGAILWCFHLGGVDRRHA